DPVTQKEFYQLYAYFTGIKEPMVSMNHNMPLPPLLKLPLPEQTKKLAELNLDKEAVTRQITRELARVNYKDPFEGNPPDAKGEAGDFLDSQIVWERRPPKLDKLPAEIQAALKVEATRRTEAQKRELREYYLRKVWADGHDVFDPLEKDLEQIAKQIKRTEDAIPYTLVSEEMEQPRPAYVLTRGDFLQKGEK